MTRRAVYLGPAMILIAAAWMASCGDGALAQTSAPAASTAPVAPATSTNAAATAAPAKAYAFDVVSIRRNISPMQMYMGTQSTIPQFGPTADGYRMTNMSLALPLMTAYVPQVGGTAMYGQDQVKGLPDWFMSERYDIDARIADEDRVEWQKPESQKVMLQAMLQAMLAERCKLAVHREVKEVGVSSLVVAKGGPKFKETDPTVEHPDGMKLPWGGVMVFSSANGTMSFYGASMASFASMMSSFGNGGRPIQDKTGLAGKYDIIMKLGAYMGPAPNEQQGVTSASDPGGSMIVPMLNDLGLKLESEKGQVETLVIDHMERPSEN
ncbi:MAG: TIGR03435 family protein [Acidobacteriaceae bacterium]